MTDIEKQIQRIIEAYQAAVLAKDVEAFMRLYHPTVRVFDTWGVWLYQDAPLWRQAVEGWFTALAGDEEVKVSFSDMQTMSEQPLATLSAIVTYAAGTAEGRPLRSMQNRITWILRETGHNLQIVHEHTSAPIGVDDFKAIFTGAPQN